MQTPHQRAADRLDPAVPPARVQLFVTCLVDLFRPEVGEAVVTVLERLGVEVEFPQGQTCCGQPAFNSGFHDDARSVALTFLEAFEATDDPIVVPSGSCGTMVRKHYRELFSDDPVALARAERVAERVYEFSEFIVDVLGRADIGAALSGNATYHQCCHLMRDLGVDRQPKALLDSIDGLQMAPLERPEECCGFGGTFALKFSDISAAMLHDKLGDVERSGAETLVAGDTGCILHMAGGLRRRGSGVEVLHLAEVLERATRGGTEPGE